MMLSGNAQTFGARRLVPAFLSAGLLLVGSLSQSITALPQRSLVDNQLITAIRDGNSEQVRDLVQRGADVNARDETGATALMLAVIDSDLELMRLLISKGADVNAKNEAGTTALLWALQDPAKAKLLLKHGAVIADAAVVVAAQLPGAKDTLRLLRDHGAKLEAGRGGFTPLMAAALGGDLDTVQFLIERGTDVKAKMSNGYTALYAGAATAKIVRLLLSKGADPNSPVTVSVPVNDIFTPAMSAAMHGNAESLRLMADKGADLSVRGGAFGRTALLWAATAGSEETVRLLINRGADINSQDWRGDTPLQWALRRGETPIVKLLREAGAELPRNPGSSLKPPREDREVDDKSVRRAVTASLPLLQESGRVFSEYRGCITCHHQSLVAVAVGLARKHGLPVNDPIAAHQQDHVGRVMDASRERILLGSGVTDDLLPAYTLFGFWAEGQGTSRITDALAHYLALKQRKNGQWVTPVYRPPHDASDFTFTALSIRGLRSYGPKGRHTEFEARIARARKWLVRARAVETEDKAFRLLGLQWAGADSRHIHEATAVLIREQRLDGGWAQLPTLESDAYATGEVLFALHEGGGIAVSDPVFRRGVRFLVGSQLADGSWYVPTRSFPFQPYFETGFPHGRSQFISTAGTSWATVALTLAIQSVQPN